MQGSETIEMMRNVIRHQILENLIDYVKDLGLDDKSNWKPWKCFNKEGCERT